MPSRTRATSSPAPKVLGELVPGDYLCSDDALYYVEYVGPERAVLEDCRTGTSLDVSIADATRLRPVAPAASGAT